MPRPLTSPQVMEWLAAASAPHAAVKAPSTVAGKLERLRRALGHLEPIRDGMDRAWTLWLSTPRGRPAEWADYRELRECGEVESYAAYLERWRAELPEQASWWRLRVVQYREQLHISLADLASSVGLAFSYEPASATVECLHAGAPEARRLLGWLVHAVSREVNLVLADAARYRRALTQRLSLRERLGLVPRRVLWGALPDAYRPDQELGRDAIAALARLVERPARVTHASLTLAQYLEACAIAYAGRGRARGERLRRGMTPRGQYLAMADGRHDGLLDIKEHDPQALADWYAHGRAGGHPFEICRGGNATHITLGFMREGSGWQLFLEGGSTGRMVETARMALALERAGVPFVLYRGEEMLLKLRGEDDVGVVPRAYHGGDARQLFPGERAVFDAVTVDLLEDAWPRVRAHVRWLPVEVTCEPATSDSR